MARGVDQRSARRRAPRARRGRRADPERARQGRQGERPRSSARPPNRPPTCCNESCSDAHLKLAPDAIKQIAAHLGDDAGRVPELVELLHSTYGDNASLSLDDVEQYLGELGTAGRFDLTNAIDRGDVGAALETLHRMLTASSSAQPKPLHPMQVMASLVFHYQRLLRLDDPVDRHQGARGGRARHEERGRGPVPARSVAKRLGSDGLREAIRLLAQAELDLRGASGLDDRTVMDVLVARLAALSRRSARR